MNSVPAGLRSLRALVIGAAREGCALARFFARLGASVTLSDAKPREALAASLDELGDAQVKLALGQRMPALDDVDALFISAGVPPTAPVVQEARRRGIPISSEPRLFTQLCPAPVLGITGSSGKTTTTSLVGDMQRAAGRATWVGGNIGEPLLERLLDGPAPGIAVMELSSFQLELFAPDYQGENPGALRSSASRAVSTAGWSPVVAAITNITPNHLDRHSSMEEYILAKSQILRYQDIADWAVLNEDSSAVRGLAALVRGRLLTTSLEQPVSMGAFLRGDTLWLRDGAGEHPLCTTGEIRLRGRHNIANVLMAACCAFASGLDIPPIREVATTFAGVPHRLEPVRRYRGALYVNDSIATSPERAVAAMQAFAEPVVLLAGGRDKHLPWGEWAALVRQRVRELICFGEMAPLLEQALERAGGGPPLHRCSSLEEAVQVAARVARPGDVVLLSPGGTSFDAYRDFEARGEAFRAAVGEIRDA